MSSNDQPEFIQPPNPLKNKVSYGPGGVSLETLEKADKIVAGLKNHYLDWVQNDLTRLQELFDAAIAADDDSRPAHLKELFRVAHDMKGQGGSFGYQLVTAVANHLCRFLERMKGWGGQEIEVIRVHADALRLIISSRMEGDGGPQGERMLKGLDAVVAKVGIADQPEG